MFTLTVKCKSCATTQKLQTDNFKAIDNKVIQFNCRNCNNKNSFRIRQKGK